MTTYSLVRPLDGCCTLCAHGPAKDDGNCYIDSLTETRHMALQPRTRLQYRTIVGHKDEACTLCIQTSNGEKSWRNCILAEMITFPLFFDPTLLTFQHKILYDHFTKAAGAPLQSAQERHVSQASLSLHTLKRSTTKRDLVPCGVLLAHM